MNWNAIITLHVFVPILFDITQRYYKNMIFKYILH